MFLRTHYPDVLVREEVAALIGLTEEKVEVGVLCIVFYSTVPRSNFETDITSIGNIFRMSKISDYWNLFFASQSKLSPVTTSKVS